MQEKESRCGERRSPLTADTDPLRTITPKLGEWELNDNYKQTKKTEYLNILRKVTFDNFLVL